MSLSHSGSIHVVTNDAKFSLGVPSRSSSSFMIWYAASFGIAFSGNLNLHQNQTLSHHPFTTHTHTRRRRRRRFGYSLGKGHTHISGSESRADLLPGVRRRRRDHHFFSLVSQTDRSGRELNSGNEFAWSLNKRGYDIGRESRHVVYL
jgi:hypothetical protein